MPSKSRWDLIGSLINCILSGTALPISRTRGFGEQEIPISLYHHSCATSWFMKDEARQRRVAEVFHYFNKSFDARVIALEYCEHTECV